MTTHTATLILSEMLAVAATDTVTAGTTDRFARTIALVGLVVTLVAFVEPRFREWRQSRKAAVEVTFETYLQPDNTSRERFVVENFGKAPAEVVSVEVAGGLPGELPLRAGLLSQVDLPIPVLHPRQRYSFPVTLTIGSAIPHEIVIGWQDGRHRRQTVTRYVTLHRVI
jgi:hypothetical protein